MGAFDWFWKAMGAQSERNNKKSKAVVTAADSAVGDIAALSDADRLDILCTHTFVTSCSKNRAPSALGCS